MAEYQIDDAAGIATLSTACEAWDRAQQARQAIDATGPVYTDRFGAPKPHPMLTVERDSRAAWLAALKQLGLEPDGVPARMGRPTLGLTAKSAYA